MTIAETLAEQAVAVRYEDISAADVHQLKRLLLDSLGCALGGRNCDTVTALLGSLGSLGGAPEATLLVGGERTSALNAVLVNGAMLRFLDLNDVTSSTYAPGARHGHNSEIFPIVLALAEREGLSGRDVLAASWLGYELATRFTESITGRSLEARGWNVDTRASFVVPFVAGRLLGLPPAQIADAVGISLARGGVLEVMDHPGEVNSSAKNLRFPLSAHLGLVSAYLAAAGVTGPARALEGGDGFIGRVLEGELDVEHLLDATPGDRVRNVSMKRFAACYATHGHLNATYDLVHEHDIDPTTVSSVRIVTTNRGAWHTGDPSRRHPTNKETADHSSFFVQGALLVSRRLGPEQYSQAAYDDPVIARIADRVSIEGDDSFDDVYPSARVTITVDDGRVLEKYVGYPLGHAQNPFSDADLEAKFADLAAPHLTAAQVEQAQESVWSLEHQADVSGLMGALTGSGMDAGQNT